MYQLLTALNIAHRGARSLAPENTLAAGRRAFKEGAHAWELDVALTADHVPVVVHDDSLARTSNAAQLFPDRAPWLVSEFTLAELRTLDLGSWFVDQDPFGQIALGGITRQEAENYRGEKIPTLEEALQLTREFSGGVNIEIKDIRGTSGDAVIVDEVVRLIEMFGLQNSVLVSSFQHEYLLRCRSINPHVATAALVEFPHPEPTALLAEIGALAYNPGLEHLDWDQAAPLREAGYGVNVWTVNEAADMVALMAAGVTGIFTDFPQRLARVLAQNKQV